MNTVRLELEGTSETICAMGLSLYLNGKKIPRVVQVKPVKCIKDDIYELTFTIQTKIEFVSPKTGELVHMKGEMDENKDN